MQQEQNGYPEEYNEDYYWENQEEFTPQGEEEGAVSDVKIEPKFERPVMASKPPKIEDENGKSSCVSYFISAVLLAISAWMNCIT